MIAAIGKRLSAFSERYVPDPFVFALLLSLATLALALVFGAEMEGASYTERLALLGEGWWESFYGAGLMKFALQMCLVLITGHALAMSRPVRRGIEALTGLASTPRAAVMVVALTACAASLVQWGLGAIAGAFMAREMGRSFARQGRAVHYPLLGAAGYAGFMVWHGGLSGSAPLKVAEPDHFLVDAIGVIPITETLLSPLNLAVTGSLLVLIPVVFAALMPSDPADMVGYTGPLDERRVDAVHSGASAGDARHPVLRWLEDSRLLNLAAAAGIFAYLGYFFWQSGAAGWNLDSINLSFLGLGILMHRSPSAYVAAVADGVVGCAGIILQFPFYFGILGLLTASGLIVQVAEWFVAVSTETTFPLFTFLSAGLVNFFVPSGGGQWAVQGPVMMRAVEAIGVDPPRAIMAMAYGDAWTNMLQPFWALPLLGIMGLRARDIIGYTSFLLLVTGPAIMGWLLIL